MIKTSIKINTTNSSYDIHIGSNILEQTYEKTLNYDKVLILTNNTISRIYFDKLKSIFSDEKFYFYEVTDGEIYKSLDSASQLYSFLIENNFSRKSLIICVGGGVISDLGGFVASTFLRGVDFFSVPTSLLAQVDASIGGKVAINHPLGKNLIGCFKQPAAVFIDIDFLNSLPHDEFLSGMGEVIKHSFLDKTGEYFLFLKNNYLDILKLDSEVLIKMISTSCEIKKYYVENDEFEDGIRAFLNFGHTYAHALETLFNFENISHGKAVSKGIIFSLYLSKELGFINNDKITQTINLFNLFKIDSTPIYFNEKILIDVMKKDKKNFSNLINFVIFDGTNFSVKPTENEIISKVNNFFKNRFIKGVIDIGTNSCRLFIAEVERVGENIKIITPLHKALDVSRLGKNLTKTGNLSADSIRTTFSIISNFKITADLMGTSELIGFATSATREAKNGAIFVNDLKTKFDLETHVIPGEVEAKMSFIGNTVKFDEKIAVIDVGGGSTEITIGTKDNIEYIKSFPIGVVKLTEMFFADDNFSDLCLKSAKNYLVGFFKELENFKDSDFKCVGVAGTVTTNITVSKEIPIFVESLVNNTILTKEMLKENLDLFRSKNLKDRKQIVGLEHNRADVIISGNLILLTLLEIFSKDLYFVSTNDNLEGAMISNI